MKSLTFIFLIISSALSFAGNNCLEAHKEKSSTVLESALFGDGPRSAYIIGAPVTAGLIAAVPVVGIPTTAGLIVVTELRASSLKKHEFLLAVAMNEDTRQVEKSYFKKMLKKAKKTDSKIAEDEIISIIYNGMKDGELCKRSGKPFTPNKIAKFVEAKVKELRK